MIYPILSSEQEIVCLQLFQAFKIPLYSLCSQLNEDHLGHTREMMSFGPSPPFPFLTVGYSLPEAGQNPCSQSQHYWSESLDFLGYQICKYFSTYFCHSITQDYPLAFTANILSTKVLGIILNICILCVHSQQLAMIACTVPKVSVGHASLYTHRIPGTRKKGKLAFKT